MARPLLRMFFRYVARQLNWPRSSEAYTRQLINHHCFRQWLGAARWQAIVWSNAEMLLIRSLGTNFSEILWNVVWRMTVILSRPQCAIEYSKNRAWQYFLHNHIWRIFHDARGLLQSTWSWYFNFKKIMNNLHIMWDKTVHIVYPVC